MAYIKNTFIYPDGTLEIEKVYSSRYGRHIRNGPREKPTIEEVEKINIRNRVKKLRRLLRANFYEDDYHITLTYPKDNRPTPDIAKKILKRYVAKLRKEYKKRGHALKYIIVTEYHNKAIHHHMVINNPENMEKVIKACWEYGHVNFSPLYADGDYEELAEYFLKETRKTRAENKNKACYMRSRNLVEPVKKTEVVKASSWREIPKAPKGYYLDKKTLSAGISDLTGRPYQYYTLVKIKRRE